MFSEMEAFICIQHRIYTHRKNVSNNYVRDGKSSLKKIFWKKNQHFNANELLHQRFTHLSSFEPVMVARFLWEAEQV